MIPVFKPYYDNRELDYLKKVIESNWWGMGRQTKEFESRFASMIDVQYAAGLNSATAALHLALHCLDVKDFEVITPSLTFVSTNHAVLLNGGIPVFCDVETDNLNITAEQIEKLVTKKTKAIIVVHYGGYACDMDPIMAVAEKYNLFVVEDCAHACGGKYKGRMLGSIGHFGCFSFHAVKNIATGDGGMLVTDNSDWHEKVKRLRWVGITKDTYSRDAETKYDWFYDVVEPGYKYHMNDLTAAVGLAQLEKLDWMNSRRRELSQRYRDALSGIPQISVPIEKEFMLSACHNFVIKTENREGLREHLNKNGISSGVHYYPNHLYKMYEQYYRNLPITESIWKQLVTLPLFPGMTETEFEKIIKAIKGFYGA